MPDINYPALPVRVTQRTLRQMVVEADPEYMQEDLNPVEYEMSSKTGREGRLFRGYYKTRGPYGA